MLDKNTNQLLFFRAIDLVGKIDKPADTTVEEVAAQIRFAHDCLKKAYIDAGLRDDSNDTE
jgi:hypothetical protein